MAFLPNSCINFKNQEVAKALRLTDQKAEILTFKSYLSSTSNQSNAQEEPLLFENWKNIR